MSNAKIVSFSLRYGSDDDILSWLESLGHRELSSTVRMCIREHMAGGRQQQRMIEESWKMLKRLVSENWVAASGQASLVGDEEGLDEDTRKNLEGLGL